MKDYESETPLTMAITNERELAVKLLLEQGFIVHSNSIACIAYCSFVFIHLHTYFLGANISTKCKNSNKVLHIACMGGNVNILQILVDNGADLQWKNAESKTALHVACAVGSNRAVEFLLTKYKTNLFL